MEFRLLGPLEVVDDVGKAVALGGRRPRAVLALVLLSPNRAVSTERLSDAVTRTGSACARSRCSRSTARVARPTPWRRTGTRPRSGRRAEPGQTAIRVPLSAER